MDRVNIAGNETGQQSNFVSKGSRRQDAIWTLDGVNITDKQAGGASPTYFDYDAFDEIQISTGNNDIRQPSGGVGLNFVVKRGTNRLKGTARAYYTNDDLEGSNVPDELQARGVTPDTADHNDQIADYGFDVGGPIVKDKAWFFGSWTKQDIRLIRASGNVLDRTILDTTNVKVNWQATEKDTINFLWFLGAKKKFGRAPGFTQVEPLSATWKQDNAYPDNPFHGLWKIEDNRIFGSSFFLSAKYAYYGTGFSLTPMQGIEQNAGQSQRLGQTFGSTESLVFERPQKMFYADSNYFANALGGGHEIKFGTSWRESVATTQDLWPGDMLVALDNSVTDQRVAIYREGFGGDRVRTFSLYVGDTFTRNRLTLEMGVRYDRQWGSALPSETQSNKAFPNLVPGISFSGYDAPFTWNNVSPRIGVTYGLDEARKTIVRASFGMVPGQLVTGLVGYANPSSSAGFVEYGWRDLNGDQLAQPSEVLLNQFLRAGGGFNPANPTGVTSPNVLDPDLNAPVTKSVVVGVDRELMPNLALQANYSYSRTNDFDYVPFVGFTAADFTAGAPVTGALPDGTPYSVPIFLPAQAKAAAAGFGRFRTNYDGYYTTYNGLEVSVIKRMSNRWMARVAASYNNPREYWDQATPVNSLGNPTGLDSEGGASTVAGGALKNGVQLAPRSAGSGSGDVFVNARWSVNLNGVYQLPWDLEFAGNLFGKQGTPYPLFRQTALGADGSRRVLVTPEVDTFRFDNLWNLDLRLAKNLRRDRFHAQVVGDLFNVFNSNTELNRQRNIASPAFQRLTSNLSPRILRLGIRLGF